MFKEAKHILKAIAKTREAPGLEIIDIEEPQIKPGHVKIKIQKGSICGTDLHIYNWNPWASSRMHPPTIIGHEFCGTIIEVGEGISKDRMNEFVASESHIICGHCKPCLEGNFHVCINTRLLGVDADGGFAPYAVIPARNARKTDPNIPPRIACLQDPLGNAVHTAMSTPIENKIILITGLGPIGLFTALICKTLGAKNIYATEFSPYRINLGHKIGIENIYNPLQYNVLEIIRKQEPDGVDVSLEMSGNQSAFQLAVELTSPAGVINILGLNPNHINDVDINKIVLQGLKIQGISGRKQWQTWEQMMWLLADKKLDISPLITHELPYNQIENAIQILKAGEAGKIIINFE